MGDGRIEIGHFEPGRFSLWPWNENERTKQKQQTNGNRAIWLVIERIQTRMAFGWWSERSRNRYFALTSYCNTIGQSNNAFSVSGLSTAHVFGDGNNSSDKKPQDQCLKCDHVLIWEESKKYILWKSLHTENNKANYGCSKNLSFGIKKNILKNSSKASKTKVKGGIHFILGIKTRWKAPMGSVKAIKVEVTNIENQQDQRGRFIYNELFFGIKQWKTRRTNRPTGQWWRVNLRDKW